MHVNCWVCGSIPFRTYALIMCACKQAYFCLQAHHVLYVVKQYPVHIVYINLCLSHAGGVSACLRLQANRLSRECCDLSLQSAGVSHNVALHHAPLQGGCHIGGDKSANMASLGLEISLCAASKPAYKCSRNELKMLYSYNTWLISVFHCLLKASSANVMLAASHASVSEVVMWRWGL